MYKLFNKVRNFIKRAVTKSVQQDGTNFYNFKVSAFDKLSDSEAIYPYGYGASPPLNSRTITWQIMGYEENLASIAYDSTTRWKGLNPGEVKIGNQTIGTFIYFTSSGGVIITSTQGVTINGGDVTINNGNLSVPDGNIGDIGTAFTTTMQEMRNVFNAHVHQPPNQPPTTQM